VFSYKYSKKRVFIIVSKYDLNFIIKKTNEFGGFCLSTVFVNYSHKYHFKCNNNHEWFGTIKSLNKGYWCDQCAKITSGLKRRKDINHLNELATKNLGKCLSNKYITTGTKYQWKCENDHIWSATANNIQRGKWCPICKESHGERKIRLWLESNNITFIRQHLFNDCYGNSKKKKPFPFDFYLPNQNLCIEFDGEQHFKPILKFGGLNSYIKCIENDKIKTEYCNRNNIKLIRIPYTSFNEIDLILKSKIIETSLHFMRG